MLARGGRGWMVFGASLLLGGSALAGVAEAAAPDNPAAAPAFFHPGGARPRLVAGWTRSVNLGPPSLRVRSAGYGGWLQCVPFARAVSGIAVVGNALSWWDHASGVYERGSRPEIGSVLNFRANGRMPLGHVAVVTDVLNSREIAIDHANWSGRGVITRGVPVVDVSAAGDWSAVRVGLPNSTDYGSVYPTYGFIYDRPDRGTMVAAPAPNAAVPPMNPPPSDLRPAAERLLPPDAEPVYEEVAEAAGEDALPARRPWRARALRGPRR